MQEQITLSRHEAPRMQAPERVVKGMLTLKAAAPIMKVGNRQAKRILARYRKEGPNGPAHQRRDSRPSGSRKAPIRVE